MNELNREPSIKIYNPQDPKADPAPYVQIIDEDDEPYSIEDWVKIVAKDSHGKDISDRVVYDASAVDFTKSGDYPVEVSVMDDNYNMASAVFVIHMLSPKEVKQVESGKPLRRESEIEREKKALKREKFIDRAFGVGLIIIMIVFCVYTYLDAF